MFFSKIGKSLDSAVNKSKEVALKSKTIQGLSADFKEISSYKVTIEKKDTPK